MAVFFNQATLTYNGGVANSNIVSGEIVCEDAVYTGKLPGRFIPRV